MTYVPLVPERSFMLPLEGSKSETYTLDMVPTVAKEVLVYVFFSLRHSGLDVPQRSYYAISTKDGRGEYTQYMNVVFTKNDFVMNSANLWLPIFPDRKLTVELQPTYPWPYGDTLHRDRRQHRDFRDAMSDLTNSGGDENQVIAEMYVIGYRT